MQTRLAHLPLRASAGAYLLNSGLAKLQADEEHHKHVHALAVQAYPVFGALDAKVFNKVLGTTEVALGSTLLVPFVSSRLAGLSLGSFSALLLGLYARVPGMHHDGTLRPTDFGLSFAKDSWLAGIALALLIDGMTRSPKQKRVDASD
jgi:hypothetical protein